MTYIRKMYHTQEKRKKRLTKPILCERDDAWLGNGYYFWNDIFDANDWGHNSKKKSGFFEVYEALINCENFLNTVLNEEHYNFWVTQIEKASKVIQKKIGYKPSIKEINAYFKERAKWNVDGIIFQDLPFNERLQVQNMNYKKRIQAAVFNIVTVKNFSFIEEIKC